MRGFRHASILAAVMLIFLLLYGCTDNCAPEKYVDERVVTQTTDLYADEPYTVTEIRVVGQKCIERHYSDMNDSRFNLSIGPREWIGDAVKGASGKVRRVVTVFNALDEIDAVYLDKVYKYNGTETKRSRTPMMFLVDPKSTRKLFFLWDTQYDPLKDITAEFTNNTEQIGFKTQVVKMCINQTEKYNVTKYRKVVSGTQEKIIGTDKVVKVKLKRGC